MTPHDLQELFSSTSHVRRYRRHALSSPSEALPLLQVDLVRCKCADALRTPVLSAPCLKKLSQTPLTQTTATC